MNNQERKTILLVEDDLTSRMVETALIERFGYDVVPAKSGEEAVEIATGNDKIALILTDIDLGSGMDGTEAAKRILGKRNLPIVFLSSHIEKEYVERIKGIAGYGYVVKNSGDLVLQSSIEMAFNLFEAQEMLQESEARNRALVSAIPDIIFTTSRDGEFLAVHAPNPSLLFVPPETFLHRRTDEVIPKPIAARFMKAYVDVLESNAVQELNYALPVGGQERHFEARIAPCTADTVITIVRDITDRKRAEEALQESEEKFSKAFQTSPYAIVITRAADGKFVEVNDAFTSMTGFTREEALSDSSVGLKLWVHEEDRQRVVAALRDARAVVGQEYSFRMKNGGIIAGLFSAQTIPLGHEPCVLSSINDITERKRAEVEREKLQAQLNQSQKMDAVGQLAGGVAHDFNNMLQVIIGTTDLLLNGMAPNATWADDLTTILTTAHRSADLTNQLLAFARKQTIAPKVLDLNDTVANLLKMLRRLIGEDIDLIWKPAAAQVTVMMDPTQITQILANLAVNARDAIAGMGKLTIETGTAELDENYCREHAGAVPGPCIVLTFSDNGCGMDQATQQHLFEPFFTTKEIGKGTGLGLATVYGIVRQNNGFIEVDSEPGRGSTFKIHLPRHERADMVAGETPENDDIPTGTETVLLVEDESSVLAIVRKQLEELGYAVLAAGHPRQALELVQNHAGEIHLLLTDVVMPAMSGSEVWQRVRAIRPAIKSLFMSGHTADVIAHRGILEEGVLFLQKPFSKKMLAVALRKALDPAPMNNHTH